MINKNKPRKKIGFTMWHLITFIITSILMLSIFGSFYFVYNNIYLTLVNAHSIFLLESDIGEETIDAAGYNKAKTYIEQKKEMIILDKNTRDIFQYIATTDTPTTTIINTTTLELN